MPLTIHIGIRGSELDTFTAQVDRLLPDPLVMHSDDDIWGEWPLTKGNPDEAIAGDAIHIKIPTMVPMVLLNFLVARMDTFLVPMAEGTKIVVTDADDDRAVYPELSYPDILG